MRLTSYVARHTWATLAYNEDIPVSKISAGLSHASEEITHTYLRSFSDEQLAVVNLQMAALVNPMAEKEWKRKEENYKYDLNGLWKFHYAKNYESTIKGFEKTEYLEKHGIPFASIINSITQKITTLRSRDLRKQNIVANHGMISVYRLIFRWRDMESLSMQMYSTLGKAGKKLN